MNADDVCQFCDIAWPFSECGVMAGANTKKFT
jgi:hypothetical protein